MDSPSSVPGFPTSQRRGLLCFGGFARHDWTLLWQRQQAVMTRLAKHYEVYYIERFGTRAMPAGELLGTLRRRVRGRRSHAAAPPLHGLQFLNPRVAPFHGARFWRRRNTASLQRAVEAAWPAGLARSVLWIYNPSYVALEYLERTAGQWGRTVYDCVQRFEHNEFYPPDIGAIDAAIARRVDLVLTDSSTIAEDKRPLNANTHFVPQGVDADRFLYAGVNRTPPDDIRWMARPLLGYHGSWHQAFDPALVTAALDAVAGARFLFVGPTFGRERALRRTHEAAVFIGPREHIRLGRYVNAFDVCLIPYRLDAHTAGVFPTKFFEYVATGLPIVATDLPDLRAYRDWAALARTPAEFVELARAATQLPRRPIEAVRPFVEEQSWDRRVERMLELIGF